MIEFAPEQTEQILRGEKTQFRLPLIGDNACPHETFSVETFGTTGAELGRLRILDVELATVYGITREDAIGEGFARAIDFNAWWRGQHDGTTEGWCWRIAFELLFEFTAPQKRHLAELYGDGKRTLYWKTNVGTPEHRCAEKLRELHLVRLEGSLTDVSGNGGYSLTPFGKRVARRQALA